MPVSADDPGTSTRARFLARAEHFGALVYDRERGDYIPFDADATRLFEGATERSVFDLYPSLEARLTRQSFETFVQLCRSIELFSEDGRFNGTFVAPRAINGMLSAPLRVHLAVTNECQMRCRHCSQDSRDPLPNELSLEELGQLFEDMAEMGTCQLAVGGGEPLLRPDLLSIVQRAHHAGLSVSLSTTATGVNRTQLKKIAELGLKSIRVSFDGAAEKSYDYYRGVKGAFRKAVRGIKTLREIFDKTPIMLHTTLMRPNLSEILALGRLVQKLHLDAWSLDFVKPVGYAAEQSALWLGADDGVDISKKLGKMAETLTVPLHMAHFPYKGPSGVAGQQLGYRCLGANLYCYVSPNGSVAPCSFTSRPFPAGNIRRKRLRDIWLDSELFRRFRQGVAAPRGGAAVPLDAHVCSFCMHAATANLPDLKYDVHAFVMPTMAADRTSGR